MRDTFNMVELNTVILECRYHRKHVPPWVHATTRDPRTLSPLPSGVEGVLSYLDPTPVSYPGFVFSDDLGVVFEAVECGCGRLGDVLAISRRIDRVKERVDAL